MMPTVASTMNDDVRAFLDLPNPCMGASLMPDGSPQLTVFSFVRDGDDLVTHCKPDAQRARNLQRDPHFTMLVLDKEDSRRYCEVRGIATVTITTVDECFALWNKKRQKYEQPASEPPRALKLAEIRLSPTRIRFHFAGENEKRAVLDKQ
jgi:general stress protein 26